MRDSLSAAEQIKSKLEKDFKENQINTENLMGIEAKLTALRNRISKSDPMDYKNIKLIYDEAVNIKTSLNVEYTAVKHYKKLNNLTEILHYRPAIKN